MKQRIIFILTIFLAAQWVFADSNTAKGAKKLNVVTSLSVLSSITREIGGDRVVVESLCGFDQDPHFVKALPSFKRLVSNADLFFQIGRSLELWVPQVINSSGNKKLISGGALVSVANGIKSLDVPKNLTREHGDIHPQGNPHVWLSPRAGLKLAENIRDALVKADITHKAVYEANYHLFKQKLAKKLFGEDLVKAAITEKGNHLKGPKNAVSLETLAVDDLWLYYDGNMLQNYALKQKQSIGGWISEAKKIDYGFFNYHSVFSYFIDAFNLNFHGLIEQKGGVAPPPRYINELVKKAHAQKITHIIAANYEGQKKLIDNVARRINGRSLLVAVDCAKDQSYIDLIDSLIKKLVDFKTLGAVKIS